MIATQWCAYLLLAFGAGYFGDDAATHQRGAHRWFSIAVAIAMFVVAVAICPLWRFAH